MELARIKGVVELRDPTGKSVGVVTQRGLTADKLAEAQRRAAAKRQGMTTDQMIAHLRTLRPQ